MKGKFKNFLADLFLPKFCLSCNKEGSWLCQDCKALLDILEYQYCLCNKNPFRLPFAGKCKKCNSKKLAGLYCALSYSENSLTKNLILRLKYNPYIKTLSETLAVIIIEHFLLSGKNPKEILKNGILIPIPLTLKKLKQRGFNQSEEIAKELSIKTGIQIDIDNLVKIKNTVSQTELSREERENNVKNAFFCKNPKEIRQLAEKNKKIFLVDDVYTTGATMEEAASTLKKAGAKEVWGIVVAREG